MRIILVVDGDLGFVVYLSLALTRAGYMAVPSTSIDGAKPLLRDLGYSKIDLLIVNFSLPGAMGLLKEFKRDSLRVIQIDDSRVARIQQVPVDGAIRKTPGADAVTRWLRTVRRVLGRAA